MKETKSIKTTSHAHKEEARNELASLGFWIYLMTDLILFSVLFATFAVLRDRTFGGPSGGDIFIMPFVLVQTMLLLTSSFTCGLAMLAVKKGDRKQTLILLAITFLLGYAFLGMEIYEFSTLYYEGFSWTRSAFLSSFFTLVGTHGLHIFIGLIWMGTLFVQVWQRGFTSGNIRKLGLLSMFWHFLDIVWIFIFTFVYLMGVI